MIKFNDFIGDVRDRPGYWVTMVLAICGATWTSGPIDETFWRGAGFFVWIFSNGYLLVQFIKLRNKPMIAMFLYYTFMNIRGVLNNW